MQQLERQHNNACGPSVAEFFFFSFQQQLHKWQWWNTGRAGLSFCSPFPTIFSTNLGFILHNQLIDRSKLDASFNPTCAESTERGENTRSKTWNKAGLNLPRPRPRLAIAIAAFHPDVAQQASGLRQPTRDAKHITTFMKSNNYLYVCGFFFFFSIYKFYLMPKLERNTKT